MPSLLDRVTWPFGRMLDMLMRDYKQLGISFTKIYTLAFIIDIIALAAIGALVLLGLGGSLLLGDAIKDPALIIPLVIIGVGVFMAFSVVSVAVGAVTYNAVHERLSGRSVSVLAKSMELLPPMAAYFFIYAIILLFAFAVVGVSWTVFGVTIVFPVIVMLLAIAALIALMFLFQFTIMEIAVNGTGVLESFRRSASLVRRNLLVTFVFDIALFLLAVAVSAVFSALSQGLSLGFALGAITPLFLLPVILAIMVVSLIQSIVTGMVTVPVQYFFWRSLGGVREK